MGLVGPDLRAGRITVHWRTKVVFIGKYAEIKKLGQGVRWTALAECLANKTPP